MEVKGACVQGCTGSKPSSFIRDGGRDGPCTTLYRSARSGERGRLPTPGTGCTWLEPSFGVRGERWFVPCIPMDGSLLSTDRYGSIRIRSRSFPPFPSLRG